MGDIDDLELTMASAIALKAAKRELRGVIKQRLSAVGNESVEKQSSQIPLLLVIPN
jgi:hypothetical protein